MGHDIYARSDSGEVAYLRRSAGDPLNTVIYEALNAMDLYAGCSGCGESRSFTRSQVSAAIESLPGIPGANVEGGGRLERHVSAGDLQPEYNFMLKSLAWMDENARDSIEIDFFQCLGPSTADYSAIRLEPTGRVTYTVDFKP